MQITLPSRFRRSSRTRQTMPLDLLDVNDDESIVEFVMSRWQTRDRHRQALERQWYTNITHYLGYQYHYYDTQSGTLRVPDAPSWRVRLVCNRLQPIARKVVSKILRAKPTWVVIPATDTREDEVVALTSNKLLEYYWRHGNMNTHVKDAAVWLSTTGNSFIRAFWDPSIGSEVPIDQFELEEEFAEGLSPEDQDIMGGGVYLGDLVFETCGPFEIDPDPECLRLEEASHLIHTKARSLSYIRGRYGKVAEGLTPDLGENENLSKYYERRIQNMAGPGGFVSEQYNAEETNAILVHSLWVPPSREYPGGGHCVVAGERVLQKGPLPDGINCIPYIHLKEIDVPGRLWGTCALEQCIPLQGAYNRARSQLVENANLMARPKWLVARGSGVTKQQLTSEPGEVVYYQGPWEPKAWTPPPIPEYTIRNMEYHLKDMEDNSSVHEVTQARAPSGVRSGVAIAQLQEADDQTLAPTFLGTETGLGRLGMIALRILAYNVKEERILRIVGANHVIGAMTFKGSDLMGRSRTPGANYFDVECQLGSQLPLSKQARLNYIIQLVNLGLLNPQTDRKRIFHLLDLGTEEPAVAEDKLDRAAAMRENMQIAQMTEPVVNSWDNDEIHLEEHMRFEKDPGYVLNVPPEAQQAMARHKMQHAQRLQAMMMPAPNANQQPAQTAPAPAPAPASPPRPGSFTLLPEE